MKYITAFILACNVLHLFAADFNEEDVSKILLPSTASHSQTVQNYLETGKTPELLHWLEERKERGSTVTKRLRNKIKWCLTDNYYEYRNNKEGRYSHLFPNSEPKYLQPNHSLIEAIEHRVERMHELLSTLRSIEEALAEKDKAYSNDELPAFDKFQAHDLEFYINDRDQLPQESVTHIEQRIIRLKKAYRNDLQKHEGYHNEILNILNILNSFDPDYLPENNRSSFFSCLPFMTCVPACHSD